MQADLRIGVSQARIGFAGPDVILNTMFEQDQGKYDAACPDQFQSAEFVQERGGLDIIIEGDDKLAETIGRALDVLHSAGELNSPDRMKALHAPPPTSEELAETPDYTRARAMERPQAQDIMRSVFSGFVELRGDGKTASDSCIRGGLATLGSWRCVIMGTTKGHAPLDMQVDTRARALPPPPPLPRSSLARHAAPVQQQRQPSSSARHACNCA